MSNAKVSGDQPAEYRHSGTSGHADSTVSGKSTAMGHFNDFLRSKKMVAFDSLSEAEVCNIQLWQQYGTYVSEFAKHKNKADEFIKSGSAKQYLSGAIAALSATDASPKRKQRRASSPTLQSAPNPATSSSAQLAVETAPARNALTLLRPPSPVVQIACTMTLLDFYKLWYGSKFSVGDVQKRWSTKVRQDQSRVCAAVRYTEAIMPDRVRSVLMAPAPPLDSNVYAAHISARNQAAGDLVKVVAAAVRGQGGGDFNNAGTLNGLTTKLHIIEKQKKTAAAEPAATDDVR